MGDASLLVRGTPPLSFLTGLCDWQRSGCGNGAATRMDSVHAVRRRALVGDAVVDGRLRLLAALSLDLCILLHSQGPPMSFACTLQTSTLDVQPVCFVEDCSNSCDMKGCQLCWMKCRKRSLELCIDSFRAASKQAEKVPEIGIGGTVCVRSNAIITCQLAPVKLDHPDPLLLLQLQLTGCKWLVCR